MPVFANVRSGMNIYRRYFYNGIETEICSDRENCRALKLKNISIMERYNISFLLVL